jgi:zinc protease
LNRLPLTGPFFGATSWEQMQFRSIAPAGVWRELLALEAGRLADPLAGVDERAVELERDITEDQARLSDDAAEVESWSDILGSDVTTDESGIDANGGTAASRRTLTLADARAFVAEHFRPAGMTLVVAGNVGDVTLDQLVGLLPSALVDAPAPGGRRGGAAAPKPPQPVPMPSPQISFVPVPTLARPVLMLTWRLPSLYTADGPALRWMQRLLSDVLDEDVLRRSDGRIASTEVRLQGSSRGALLIVEVELLNATSPELVVQIVENRLLTFARNPAGGQERFEYLRRRLWTWMAQGGDPPVERALSAASLSNTFGRIVSPTVEANAMANVAWVDVTNQLWRWLAYPPHRALRVPAPVVSQGGAEPVFAKAGTDLLAEAGRWDQAALRPVAVSPGLSKAQQVALPNGATLLFLRRPGPNVIAWMGYRGGLSSAPTPALGRWASGLRPRFGDWAVSHGLLIGGGSDVDTTFDTVSFRAPQLDEALGLLVSRARGGVANWPTADEFARSMFVQPGDDEPGMWSTNLFWRNLYPQHPYGRTYSVADSWRVTPQAAAVWVGGVVRPENAALVVVGDLDPQVVIEASRRMTRDWVAPVVHAPAPALPSAPRLRESSTGPRAAVVDRAGPHMVDLQLGCLLPATESARAARWVLERAVHERLNSDLRHASGHSQGASVHVGEPRAAAQLAVSMSIDPGHFRAVLATIHRNWMRWGGKGFDAGETNAGRWSAVGRHAGMFEDPEDVANVMFNEWNQGHPPADMDALASRLLDVTPADLTSIFARCRDNAALILTGERATIEPVLKATWPGLEPAI